MDVPSLQRGDVWCGEKRAKLLPKSKKRTHSGINVAVSNASFENFKRQISGAIQFLIKNKIEIQKLTRYKGVEGVELDFATTSERDVFLQEYIFPVKLITLAAKLDLEIRLSAYPPSDK